jgi:hypothetical protein
MGKILDNFSTREHSEVMFEEAQLLGSTERSIVVQTRRGREVKNLIELEPGEREQRKYERLFKQYGRYWVRRKPASGVYNCAGHVWASRRTAIFEESAWEMILQDDAYRKLPSGEQPMPGDLVIYRDSNVGFLHVGMILELRSGITQESSRIPWVLSKWDSTSGEVLHHVQDVPFNQQHFTFLWEYWSDRSVS